jgi:putative (di)nucleoside polyphosphate hydrolase
MALALRPGLGHSTGMRSGHRLRLSEITLLPTNMESRSPMKDFASLPYRPCVGVMLVNSDGKVFVGKRIDTKEGDWWQMPQGGVDDGEDLKAAALRELWEETGATEAHVTILSHTKEELLYDLPEELIGKLWKGKYRGQRQTWYLARFEGKDGDIDLEAHKPAEFCDWKWVDPELLPDLIVPFKKRVYRTVLEEFRALI